MGNKSSSSSSSTNKVKEVIVNKNTVNQLNEQINSAVAKTVITQKKQCSSNVDQSQTIDLSGCKVQGDINITNTKQQQVAVVDLSCIQASEVSNEMAQQIMNEMMSQIKSGLDSKSLADMSANAKSAATTGFLSTGSSSSKSTTVNDYDLRVVNDNTTDIQNVVKNAIDVQFNVEDVQQCVNQASQRQALNLKNCQAGGSVNISEFTQDQGIKSTTNCLQQSGMSNKVTTYAGTMLGVTTEADTVSTSDVKQSAAAESTATSSGIEAICNPMSSASCGMCIFIIIIACAILMYMNQDTIQVAIEKA
jgi:hypothetical protein